MSRPRPTPRPSARRRPAPSVIARRFDKRVRLRPANRRPGDGCDGRGRHAVVGDEPLTCPPGCAADDLEGKVAGFEQRIPATLEWWSQPGRDAAGVSSVIRGFPGGGAAYLAVCAEGDLRCAAALIKAYIEGRFGPPPGGYYGPAAPLIGQPE